MNIGHKWVNMSYSEQFTDFHINPLRAYPTKWSNTLSLSANSLNLILNMYQ